MMCPHCKKEMGEMEEGYEDYSSDSAAKMGALESIMSKLPELGEKPKDGEGMIAIEVITAEPKKKKA